MKYYSTGNRAHRTELRTAVLEGLAPDGGLYMPEKIPKLPREFFEKIDCLSFQEIALEVASALIGEDIPPEILKKIITAAYTFDAPLRQLDENAFVLELYHGHTVAFKDFGARFMARLMAYFVEKEKTSRGAITILAATSGDTGSAVGSAFHKVPGFRVVLLYPSGKVSHIQEQQLTTIGDNVSALEVEGTFDDCQRLVKEAFQDGELRAHIPLSSANSINIARLIPQTFYYFSAYAQLLKILKKTPAQVHNFFKKPIIFSVPSGNLGNLTAGLFAKKMGSPPVSESLPASRHSLRAGQAELSHAHFIAACNLNDILPRYLQTGQFQPRPSQKTLSNAMDVGNPSNFARIQALYHNDLEKIRADITGYSFTDDQTRAAIKEICNIQNSSSKIQSKLGFLNIQNSQLPLDPHGAVAYLGLKEYHKAHPQAIGILLATAHPAKFADIVEPIIGQKINIPPVLQQCLISPKQAIKIPADYHELKKYLTDNR